MGWGGVEHSGLSLCLNCLVVNVFWQIVWEEKYNSPTITNSDNAVFRTALATPYLCNGKGLSIKLNVTLLLERKTAYAYFQMVSVNLHASESSYSAESFTRLYISSSGKGRHQKKSVFWRMSKMEGGGGHYGPYNSLTLCFNKNMTLIRQYNGNICFWWIFVKNSTCFCLATYYLNISWCCKAMKVNLIKNCYQFQGPNGYMQMSITFYPLKLVSWHFVCVRGKSAPLTNFQPNWTTRSKVSNFCHFICSLS